MNRMYEQKLKDRENLSIRVKEAHKHLRATSPLVDSGTSSMTSANTSLGRKRDKYGSKHNVTADDLEVEIEALKSLLAGRDKEVKVIEQHIKLVYTI